MKSKMYWVTKLIRRPELPKTVIDEVHTGGYCKKEFEVYAKQDRKYCSQQCYVKDRFGK